MKFADDSRPAQGIRDEYRRRVQRAQPPAREDYGRYCLALGAFKTELSLPTNSGTPVSTP